MIFLGILLGVGSAILAQDVETNGSVCGNPASPCVKSYRFPPHDLSFTLPAKLKWQTNYRSAYFYAIILKSRPVVQDENVDDVRCSRGYYSEEERSRVQALFPAKKVFATRNGCYMPSVWYTNVNSKYEFVSVYAGTTEAEAKALLPTVKVKGFIDANIRKMHVALGNGD